MMNLSLRYKFNLEDSMSKDSVRQLANALSVALALAVNILASTLPLNGQNTGAVSYTHLRRGVLGHMLPVLVTVQLSLM